jgi:hypothetical protein
MKKPCRRCPENKCKNCPVVKEACTNFDTIVTKLVTNDTKKEQSTKVYNIY